jgi:hypothetical protein
MKELIVMMGILPLLTVFIMQFAADFKSGEELETVRNLVYSAKEIARMEGGFSAELRRSLANDIEERLSLDPGSVLVEAANAAGSVGRYDEENRIDYTVRVKLPGTMAGARFMGIGEEKNEITYVIDSFTTSEYLGGY